MIIPGFRASSLPRYLGSLLLLLAIPAAADIDTSILRSMNKGAGAAATVTSRSIATAVVTKQPTTAPDESPGTWYQRASTLDRPGANANDVATAVHWYPKAAEMGHTDAQTNLAAMYAEGRGVDVDMDGPQVARSRGATGRS